jgi:hypothetical protein
MSLSESFTVPIGQVSFAKSYSVLHASVEFILGAVPLANLIWAFAIVRVDRPSG